MRNEVIRRICAGYLVARCLVVASAGDGNEWPQFRGPAGSGIAQDPKSSGVPTEWDTTNNVAWRIDVPGLGWSSPIVWGNRVFLTTAVDAQGTEQPEEGFYLGKDRGGRGEHRWLVLACDLNTGTKLWERQVHQAVPACTPLKSSYASATPVTDGERVYAWFGEFGLLVALPLTGYGDQITGNETLLANQVFVGGKMMIEARWPNLADSDGLSNRADFLPIAKDAWTAGPGGTAILRDAGIPEIAGGCSEDLGRLVLSTNGSMTAKHCISGPPVAECQSPDALQPVRIPMIVPAQYPDRARSDHGFPQSHPCAGPRGIPPQQLRQYAGPLCLTHV